ncbi:helicase-related protein [Benzoatithermus flavus]|uniref:Helicase-related protein n=1 Tax=Benzoatithermus flavus TaxID=3108223 RepID=A0ABU8XLA8_9PROT
MVRQPASPGRVVAVLGPTNTGKTHFAVERMLAHQSGMMGFPLRLLAREIYDRVVAVRGKDSCALITGEEKVGRDDARYLICTVEAMPMHREVAFLAVDEIQLCADYERGHIFTDRLLHARGYEETMFLGSDTIRPILKRLVPSAEIVTRPRFSTLSFAGDIKLHRLPRRSAVVAFSAAEVYTLAEVIRRQRGGAAVVLGALSPRTRNAQVAMYQAGEVEHLVATDAIGMGLNMDVAHVAFADLTKFDGRESRRLTTTEMAQIAGRAGRHMASGTFGGTNGCQPFEEREIEAIESHTFPPLKALRWRNSDLDFRSVDTLTASLDRAPELDCLVKVRDALDHRSLVLLSRRDDIRAAAQGTERVRLLWQVCQIPDFRKTLTDAHLHLLATVYKHLTGPERVLPNDWVGGMIAHLERTDGDIDTLVNRIAHIRTWTYMSHRTAWLRDAAHWQERAREVEDRLSDALHERLIQRFVDRRTSALLRSLRERGEHAALVEADGEVVVDGHLVGRIEGLKLAIATPDADADRRLLAAAARRAAQPALRRKAGELAAADDDALSLDEQDCILWRGAVVAQLRRGTGILRPRIELEVDGGFDAAGQEAVRRRLERWLEDWIGRRLERLKALELASRGAELGGPGRGIAFRLVEHLGSMAREEAESLVAGLDEADRRMLTRLGVRFGMLHLYVPDLLRPAANEARARLLRIFHGRAVAVPPPGRTVLRPAPAGERHDVIAVGFASFGGFALRVDILERLAARIRTAARGTRVFTVPAALAAEAGLSRAELFAVVEALGFRAATSENGEEGTFTRPPQRKAPRHRPKAERHEKGRRAAAGRTGPSPFAVLAQLKVST